MRKTWWAALTAAALTFVGPARAADDVKSDVKQGVTKAREGAEQLGQQAKQSAQDIGLVREVPSSAYRAEKAYELDGIVSKASNGRVTIAREGLPPAALDVRERTRLTLDGKSISASELPEGARVRARFQLSGTEPVAVSIDASMNARPVEPIRP